MLFALQKAEIQANERIQTVRIRAITDIATAYYKSQVSYIFFW